LKQQNFRARSKRKKSNEDVGLCLSVQMSADISADLSADISADMDLQISDIPL
jgi:hypothetical protein